MNTPATRRPLNPVDSNSLAKGALDGLKDLVSGSPNVFVNRPAFIAGEGSTGLLSTAVRTLSQYNCRRWAAADKSGFSTRVNTFNAELCNPYLESLGEKPDDGGIGELPLEGQCNVQYEFRYSIGGFEEQPQTNSQVIGPMSTPIRTEGFGARWTAFNGGGSLLVFGNPNPANQGTFIGWRRLDGLPDDCGGGVEIQPPSTVVPQTPIPPRIQINLPGFGPVNVTVNLGEDGNPDFNIEEIGVSFGLDIGGDSAGGDGGGGGGGRAPGDVGNPDVPVTIGPGADADGEAPEGQVLGALKIDIIEAVRPAREFKPGIWRGACYIYMGTPDGLDHDPAGAMLRDGQLILAEKENLTRWLVQPNSGYTLRVTPYYVELD